MHYYSRLLLLLIIMACAALVTAQTVDRLHFGAKFEPPAGVLHGVGQNEEFAFANYVARMEDGRFPTLFMTYIPVRADSARLARTITELKDMVRYYPPELMFQIGISMTTGAPPNNAAYTEDINAGVYDDNIDLIARSLDSLERDIFLRIGYEANGFWNGYSAASYRPAFRRVAERFRAQSDRFATVWCTHPITSLSDMMTYYPGDDVVDWWAIDWFQPSFMNNGASRDFLAEALRRERPVMIGEATPTGTGIGNGQASWDAWYARFFELIRTNPGVKAFCYINRDWTQISSLPDWGNALLEHDTTVLRLYREELDNPLYVHLTAGDGYRSADLAPAAAVSVRSAAPTDPAVAGATLTSAVGAGGQDTTLTYLRFELDEVADADSLRVVKLWVAGRNGSTADVPFTVYRTAADWTAAGLTYANRPGADALSGRITVNDNRRDKLNWLDVTDHVRAALAQGQTSVAFLLGPPDEAGQTFTFQGAERSGGYAPALQVVYAQPSGSVATHAPRRAAPLRLYPNPTDGAVWLSALPADGQLSVLDSAGRAVLQRRLPAGDHRVDLSALPRGVYQLHFRSAAGLATGRVVVE